MISKSTLEQSIREATDSVRDRERAFVVAQNGLGDAQRELRLLLELAELRGLDIESRRGLMHGSPAEAAANGSLREASGLPASSTKSALLSAVVEILAEQGAPMQIRELMAAVQRRGVAIPGSGQQANLIAHISRNDRIVRPRRGYYALRDWGIEDAKPASGSKRRRSVKNAGASR